MYGFVDTIPGETKIASLSLKTIFNGINLDEALSDVNGRFVTISVGGRGVLSRHIYLNEKKNGANERGYGYDIREITVNFLIEDKTNEGFRERFNHLNSLLLGSKKVLEFTDENAYFISTLKKGDIPDEDSNTLVGSLTFICSDPAKYKNKQTLNLTSTYQTHQITGQASTPWTTRTVFSVPQSKFTLEGSNGLKVILNHDFIAGDVLEIDSDKRDVWLNGEDIATAVDITTEWNKGEIEPGNIQLKASHATEFIYDERYY